MIITLRILVITGPILIRRQGMEEQVIKEGITLNSDLTGYLIPTSMDTPRFVTQLVENEDSEGPYGAKGIGEPATIAVTPAIANAIYDAVGVRILDLPITPEKILRAWKETENRQDSKP